MRYNQAVKPNIENKKVSTKKINPIFFHFSKIVSYFIFSIQRLFKKSIPKSDFLFIDVEDKLYIDRIGDKVYSRYISPYFDYIKTKGSVITINVSDTRIENSKRQIPVIIFNLELFFKIAETFNFYKNKFLQKQSVKIENFDNFLAFLESINVPKIISEQNILFEMDKIFTYKNIWKKALFKSKPKAIFMECYYGSNYKYGLFLAANELNIKTVDIQHGIALGLLYTGWNSLKSKNNMLPSAYWCWSSYDEQIVTESRKGNQVFKAIVGGNLWLKHCLESNTKNDSNIFVENLIADTKPEKVILVTLQHSIPVSTILIEAIKQSPKEWLWLIRFHPFDFVDPNYRKTYINSLSNCKNVEYNNTTIANLYALLARTNIHVTHHSNVAVEAISFKVPTILLGAVFENWYKDYITSGQFYVSTNSNQILSYISEGINVNEVSFEIFKMRFDLNSADNFLNRLLA